MLVKCCLIHDKCCIDYPDQKNENREPWGDIGGYYGDEKGGETQINSVLAPCPIHAVSLGTEEAKVKDLDLFFSRLYLLKIEEVMFGRSTTKKGTAMKICLLKRMSP